jgi:hypothetical protein
MRAYVITTGTIFGLVTLAHVARIIIESPALATDPGYVLLTLASAALCVWALRLVRLARV